MRETNKEISIKVLGKYRTELMAVGIVLVMLCHSTIQVGPSFQQAYSVIRQFCQIGVDMFLFLSGYGIYHALTKSNDVRMFYKKRLIRLFVPYILVLIIWGIAQIFHNTTGGLRGFVYSYSLVTFFLRGELSEWYLAAIIPLYIISPWLVKYIKKKQNSIYVLISTVLVLSVVFLLGEEAFSGTKYSQAFSNVNDIMVIRIPMFLAGIYVAKNAYREKLLCVSKRKAGRILVLGVILFAFNTIVFPGDKGFLSQWYISRAIFGIICIPLLLLTGNTFERIKGSGRGLRVLGWIGTLTLELYLLHEKVLSYLESLLPKSFFVSVITNILAVVIALLLAFLVSKAAKRIQQSMFKRKQAY